MNYDRFPQVCGTYLYISYYAITYESALSGNSSHETYLKKYKKEHPLVIVAILIRMINVEVQGTREKRPKIYIRTDSVNQGLMQVPIKIQ